MVALLRLWVVTKLRWVDAKPASPRRTPCNGRPCYLLWCRPTLPTCEMLVGTFVNQSVLWVGLRGDIGQRYCQNGRRNAVRRSRANAIKQIKLVYTNCEPLEGCMCIAVHGGMDRAAEVLGPFCSPFQNFVFKDLGQCEEADAWLLKQGTLRYLVSLILICFLNREG